MPAPDSPVTSSSASSACAFFIVSCICCAWRIKFPKPPFIMPTSSSLVHGLHGSRIHTRAEALTQSLDGRVRLERGRGAAGPVLFRQRALPRGGGEVRLGRFVGNAYVALQILRQTLHQLVLDGPRAAIRRRLIELQRQNAVLERRGYAIQGELAHHAAQARGVDRRRPTIGIDARLRTPGLRRGG